MNLVEDPRAAGEVRRYHTWAVHKDQTVGLHTWQILRILLTIWPNCPRNVIVYGLVHDAGEMSGDIQYPFKILFTELRAGADKAENHVRKLQRESIGAPEIKHPLSVFEAQVFKCCDNLDMWEFGLREMNMGNLYATLIVERMAAAVAGNINNLEGMKDTQQYQQNSDLVPTIHRYMKKRIEMETINGTR
jgi:5'-deoxynucleotidase YfbR-like HD superfamily hydrolase